ncbi:2451_t:CDS:2 [Dentiscutata erythropus]|uniref:chitin deacetylase n=1 Tax=Dentiscutata erythropus TaxID=1348616 RepID=A0A9N9HR74_9GLOM|nr:2451_t:CDS:2 [Dentiscutata erythropus]
MAFNSFFITLVTLATAVIAQQCVPYSTPFDFKSGYPTVWTTPGDECFNTDEFKSVYNSIDWSKVPDIKPHELDSDGNLVSSGYPSSDPDCWWSYNMCVTPKVPGLKPDISYCPEPNTLGLSYDDGPNCTHNEFYDFLKANNQKATMYFIGSNVADWPYEAQRALTDGHQICVHTWSHRYMTTLTNQQVLAELYYTRKVIKYVMGVTPLCWRPPYGDVDDRVRAIAAALNMSTDVWNLDSNDWQMQPAGELTSAKIDQYFSGFCSKAKNGTFANSGALILEHELNSETMSKAQQWYPTLKSSFEYIVPVATCMNITQPYAETNYTYPSFAQYINATN